MNLFKKYYYLLPFFLIILQIFIVNKYNFNPTISPNSSKNMFLSQLTNSLNIAGLKPKKIIYRDFQSEVEFYLTGKKGYDYQVVVSTNKNPLLQVTALQKLIEIANIKDANIQFIDLSSSRPYATF